MLVTRVEDALALVADWADRTGVVPAMRSPAVNLPPALPVVIEASARLGDDFYVDQGHRASLLTVQDRIFPPGNLEPDADGITLFINENQGVYAYGFKPDDPEQLWVTGDWNDRLGSRDPESWRMVDATTEDALIATVLMNGFFALSYEDNTEYSDDSQTVPPDTDRLVWKHPAFGNWPGFWTNANCNRLHFGGMGSTLIRP